MKFAVKYRKNALGWSHSVPQSCWGGMGAGSNLTCMQCPVGSVRSRREKELLEVFVPDICTQLWLWTFKGKVAWLRGQASPTSGESSWHPHKWQCRAAPCNSDHSSALAKERSAASWAFSTLGAAVRLWRQSGKLLLDSPNNLHARPC